MIKEKEIYKRVSRVLLAKEYFFMDGNRGEDLCGSLEEIIRICKGGEGDSPYGLNEFRQKVMRVSQIGWNVMSGACGDRFWRDLCNIDKKIFSKDDGVWGDGFPLDKRREEESMASGIFEYARDCVSHQKERDDVYSGGISPQTKKLFEGLGKLKEDLLNFEISEEEFLLVEKKLMALVQAMEKSY